PAASRSSSSSWPSSCRSASVRTQSSSTRGRTCGPHSRRASGPTRERRRREADRVGAQLAAANQFLRSHVRVGGERGDAPTALSDELRVEDGYELALAAALGGRLEGALLGGGRGGKGPAG